MAQYKNQHYIPQSYQEAWLDPDTPSGQTPWVWVFPKDGGEPRRKAPIKLFKESDLYTVRKPDGSRDVQLERDLGHLDGDFASLRRDVLEQRGAITEDVKARLAFFAAVMSARVIKERDHQREQWGRIREMAEKMMQGALRRSERGEPPERGPFSHWSDEDFAKAGIQRTAYDPDAMSAMIAQPMPMLLSGTVSGMMPFLLDMHLAILCTDSDPGFITSDAPCARHDGEAQHFVGMGSPTLEVTLPLSPRQAAMFSWQALDGYLEVPEAKVHLINRRTGAHAYREFISHREHASPGCFGE